MPSYQSDPRFLHPLLHSTYETMLAEIVSKLPSGWKAHLSSEGVHRTPKEQFELFKQGRKFQNGEWVIVKKSEIVTHKDGFENKSRHNYLPATALDVILFRPNGTELKAGKEENKIEAGAIKYGFEWGGNWSSFQDKPHIQLPLKRLFKEDLDRDEALQWQKYLFHAGALTSPDELDGFFGQNSKTALQSVIGTTDRTPGAWSQLVEKFGPLEAMNDFDAFNWIPKVR